MSPDGSFGVTVGPLDGVSVDADTACRMSGLQRIPVHIPRVCQVDADTACRMSGPTTRRKKSPDEVSVAADTP